MLIQHRLTGHTSWNLSQTAEIVVYTALLSDIISLYVKRLRGSKMFGLSFLYTMCIKMPPVVDVVVLSSPSPVLIGEAIDFEELLLAQARNPSKISRIRQPGGEKKRSSQP